MVTFIQDASFIMPGLSRCEDIFAALTTQTTSFSKIGDKVCGQIAEIVSQTEVDRVVTLAAASAKKSTWKLGENTGVIVGSSRGATTSLEAAIGEFEEFKEVSPHTSPKTTLGLISATVAQELRVTGFDMTHSSTCSTALMSVINGMAWCEAGFVEQVVVGASEAPLTPFGFAQMEALRIYSKLDASEYPSRPFSTEGNSFILAEGAGLFLLGKEKKDSSLGKIVSFGTCVDRAPSRTGVSPEGDNFVSTMSAALKKFNGTIDCVVCHSTGTMKGDRAELNAVKKVFGERIPLIAAPKWLHGHSFAASGVLGIAAALSLLGRKDVDLVLPYENEVTALQPKKVKEINNVLVNSSGFGGNTASIIISRV